MRHVRPRRRGNPRTLIGVILLIAAAAMGTIPFTLMLVNRNADTTLAATHATAVDEQDAKTTTAELSRAREYNTTLAQDGSTVLGEAVDPWGDGSSTLSEQDENYRNQLDSPADGIMATIEYPRLGINLPIRHGTSRETLAAGAGHMYGTSLPVGGKSTHAVISAHTGLADHLMFDRLSLGEGREGDVFYIHVLGKTLAYTVTSITTVDPTDFSQFSIQNGKDQVTLLTCTPYGVNNKRLLVTGTRTTMPDPAPEPEDAPKDMSTIPFACWIGGVWLTLTIVLIRLHHSQRREQHHGSHKA